MADDAPNLKFIRWVNYPVKRITQLRRIGVAIQIQNWVGRYYSVEFNKMS